MPLSKNICARSESEKFDDFFNTLVFHFQAMCKSLGYEMSQDITYYRLDIYYQRRFLSFFYLIYAPYTVRTSGKWLSTISSCAKILQYVR